MDARFFSYGSRPRSCAGPKIVHLDSATAKTASDPAQKATGRPFAIDPDANSGWIVNSARGRVVAAKGGGFSSTKPTLAIGPCTSGASEVLMATVKSGNLVRTVQIVQ